MNAQQARVEHREDVAIITFTDGKIAGEENFIARELVGRTERLRQRHLFLDFSNVECINSSEVSAIICLHKKMKAAGGRLTLAALSPQVSEVMERTRLNRFLDIRQEVPPRSAACLTEREEVN
jgi:anti-anti-sigma factor